MHGIKEKECLEYIKSKIFTINPFSNKTYDMVSDEEFNKEHSLFIKFSAHDNFYGMSNNDCILFENTLRKAISNPNSSEFPDFISDNGFIEHFQISSSKTNRKGANHQIRKSAFEKQAHEEIRKFKNDLNENPSFDKVQTKNMTFNYNNHSYEFLLESMKGIWQKHINSLNKYNGCKNVGIFLIDFPETIMRIAIDYGIKTEIHYGDMLYKEENPWYRFSRDPNILGYIYEYRKDINYVIFRNNDYFEVISTENISELLKLLPWKYKVYPCSVVVEQQTISGFSVKY